MTTQTPCGNVDKIQFESFQNDFDTDRILHAIHNLDKVAQGVTGMQEELRELHRMAEKLISADLAEVHPAVPDHECMGVA